MSVYLSPSPSLPHLLQVLASGTLVIDEASKVHSAAYICTLLDGGSVVGTQFARVTVQGELSVQVYSYGLMNLITKTTTVLELWT